MMVKFITLLVFAFDINRDLLIKDLIKFEVLGSKCMRRRFTIYSAFLDIKNSISWYQEMNSWYQEIFLDIKNSISWYQEFDFLISRLRILDIKKSNSWYQETYFEALFYYSLSISWYQEIDLLISRIHFLISRNEIHFLISRNRFLDIKKYILRCRFTIY